MTTPALFASDDEKLERELPLALKTVSIQLSAGQSFEQGLHAAAHGFGTASARLRKALDQINSGATVQQAFGEMARRSQSISVKRACSQIVFAYEHGAGSEAIEQAASQMVAEQQARLARFNSRASFLGVLFIAASCIAPALSAAYLIIGSAFLSLSVTPLQAAALFLAAFPLVDAALLAALYKLAPLESAFGE